MFGIWNQPTGFYIGGGWIKDGNAQPLSFETEADALRWLNENRAEQLRLTGERGWPDATVKPLPD